MRKLAQSCLVIVIASMVAGTAAAVEVEDILIYWSFDNISGDTVPDESGNGYDGTLAGSVDVVDGKFFDALQFSDGGAVTSGNVDVLANLSSTGQITLESWVYLIDHVDYAGIISIEAVGGDCCEFRTLVNPNLNPYWNAGHHVDKTSAAFTFETETWHHYVLVADGDDSRVYVDGELIATEAEDFPLPDFPDANVIIAHGESVGVHPMETGIIDEVVIYNKALTEDEVNASMNDGVKGVLAVGAKGKLATRWATLKATR